MSAIRDLRRQAGLTQVELAARLSVTQAAVSGYEHGRPVPAALLDLMAEALNVAPADLEPGATAPAQRGRRRGKKRSPQAEEGARYIQTLTFFRAQARLTLEDVTRRSGVSRHRLSGMEAGLIPVDAADARSLADVLQCVPEEIQTRSSGSMDTGAALLEAHDPGGRPVEGKAVTPEARQLAHYELGLAEAPLAKQPTHEKRKGKPKFPASVEVARYRRALGLSQKEVAERAGVSQPAVSAIESGQAPLLKAVWRALAAEFGVDPEQLGAGAWREAI